jgi:hypothetical protein
MYEPATEGGTRESRGAYAHIANIRGTSVVSVGLLGGDPVAQAFASIVPHFTGSGGGSLPLVLLGLVIGSIVVYLLITSQRPIGPRR